MENLEKFIAKVTSIWASIGAALITVSAFIPVPEVILSLFSAEASGLLSALLTAVVAAIGAGIIFVQYIRVQFNKPKPVEEGGEVLVLNEVAKGKWAFNPFKVRLG